MDLKNNIRYASPNIIYSEIIDGFYIAPISYIEAVKNAPLPDEEEYVRYMY